MAQYNHRIAISNLRIIHVDDGHVAFRYKEYRDGNRHKVMALEDEEFVRRFLLHILPTQIRTALAQGIKKAPCAEIDKEAACTFYGYPCPECRIGRLRVIGFLAPLRFEGG